MGYRVEYSNSNAAGCKGKKPCSGTKILKGELRFGTIVEFNGKTTWAWRHWGCVTPKVIQNVKNEMEGDDPELLDGYELMNEDDQARITKAWEVGDIDDADRSTHVKAPLDPLAKLTIPELKERLEDADLKKTGTKDELVARLREHEGPVPEEASDEEGAKKGKGKGKAAKAKNGDAKEKKKPKKAKKAASSDEEESEAQDSEEEEKPAKKRKLVSRGAAAKSMKEESDEESEAAESGSEAASSTAGPPKKTKKAEVAGDKRKRAAKKEESGDDE